MTEWYYAEEFKEEFDMEIDSWEFGFKSTIYIEGSPYEYHNKYQNDVIND